VACVVLVGGEELDGEHLQCGEAEGEGGQVSGDWGVVFCGQQGARGFMVSLRAGQALSELERSPGAQAQDHATAEATHVGRLLGLSEQTAEQAAWLPAARLASVAALGAPPSVLVPGTRLLAAAWARNVRDASGSPICHGRFTSFPVLDEVSLGASRR